VNFDRLDGSSGIKSSLDSVDNSVDIGKKQQFYARTLGGKKNSISFFSSFV